MPEKYHLIFTPITMLKPRQAGDLTFPHLSFCTPVFVAVWMLHESAWSKLRIYILVFIICFISGPLTWTDPATNHTLACLQGRNWSLAFQVIIKIHITGHPTLTSTPSWSVLSSSGLLHFRPIHVSYSLYSFWIWRPFPTCQLCLSLKFIS